MSDRTLLFDYVRDFELAFLTDDWQRLDRHFSEDAAHVVPGGGILEADHHGRRAVVDGLRDVVHALDRRFDARIAEIVEGPIVRDDGVYMRWRLELVREGLPELVFGGDHLAVYRGDEIARLEEHVDDGAEDRVDAFLDAHGPSLRPAGSSFELPPPALLERVQAAVLRSAVRGYAAAKSQQDIAGALAGCAPDFAIETLPFGFDTGDRASTARQLALFFQAFPDYRAETEGLAVQGDQVAWWGTIHVTSGGSFLGIEPTGRSTSLPAFSVFDFRGIDLVRERFHFDLVQLCGGLGLPHGRVLEALEPLRRHAAA